jgi:hypothetical protein
VNAVRHLGSGVEVDTKVFVLFTMRDGKVLRVQSFLDEREAHQVAASAT